ncbi:MAG: GWxTD domain-containing protein [bacterium]
MLYNKRYKFFILIFLSFIISYKYTDSQSKVNFTAQDYLNQGLSLYKQGKILPAIEAIKVAVNKDRKFAEAYHQLALLYIKLGTIEGRMKATRSLEKALRLDRKNVRYHLSMAKLLLKKGMQGAAKSRFKKVLKLDANNAEAYYYLGLMKKEDMLWYQDLISPQGYIVFDFKKYANEDLLEAVKYFNKAVALDPKFAKAYYHLALMQYELYDYKSMADYLQKAIDAEPNNKDFYLFLGLAYHRMGRYDSAYESYNKAKLYMSEQELALFNSIELLLNPQLKKQFAALSGKEKQEFEIIFWKQRDPYFITDYNERILEHYSRFAYANMRFGFPEKGIEGWRTDRGKAYIRFGAPKVKFRTRPYLELASRGNPLIPSQEYWDYDDFQLSFEDPYLSRNFTFKRSFNPDEDSKYLFGKLIKDLPDYYDHNFNGIKFELPHLITQFKGDSGKTKIELYYGVPRDHVSLTAWGDSIKAMLKKGVFIFDENWQDISRTIQLRKYSIAGTVDKQDSHFLLDRHPLELEPGKYRFCLELEDENSGNVGIFREQINIRPFRQKRLDMSDLLLACKIETNLSFPVYNIGNLNIIPSLFHTFTPNQPVFVYFEIYNLSLDENNLSHYQVESILQPLKSDKSTLANLASRVGRIFGLGKTKVTQVSTSYRYIGNLKMERHHSSIQLANAISGKYMLTIRITDLNSGQKVENDVRFVIIENTNEFSVE